MMRLSGALAVALLIAAAVPARADRDLFTMDCQGQFHMFSDTPFSISFGAKGAADMWTHIMDELRDRLKCKCGGDGMPSDEFLRKYSPASAMLNLLKKSPDNSSTCDTSYSILHPTITDYVQQYLHKYVINPKDSTGILPCSYADLTTTGGCAFELKSTNPQLPFGIGVAMKSCPSNPDMTFVSAVAKGAMVDNLGKPCSGVEPFTCGDTSMMCKDPASFASRRRSRFWSFLSKTEPSEPSTWREAVDRFWSFLSAKPSGSSTLRDVADHLLGKADTSEPAATQAPASQIQHVMQEGMQWLRRELSPEMVPSLDVAAGALRSMSQSLADGLDAVQAASPQLRSTRSLLALQPSDADVYSFLESIGLYDTGDGSPGCLTYSNLVENARGYAQAFFADATVAQDASYNVCVPNFNIDNIQQFFKDNWGVEWKYVAATGNEAMHIPFEKWDGSLSRGRNVFDAGRLDGSAFTGSATALHPPAAIPESSLLPVAGATCLGTAFFQVGNKLGGGVQAQGVSSMMSFVMEQAMKMQQCRAVKREAKFIFARPDFLMHFALYTPISWLSILTKPPAGKEFKVLEQKMRNDWQELEITMSTVVKKMFTDAIKPSEMDFRIDMSAIDTCTAKDYGTKGCSMGMGLANVGFGTTGASTQAVMGMAQCFSSALTVPFPTAGVGLIGNAAMTAWPIKSCTKNSDCATGTECGNSLGLSAEMIKLDDPYDLLVYGEDTAARGSAAASCGSTKGTDNKGVAKVIEYFTGAAQDPTNFAFCMPKFEQPNLEAIFEQAGDYESKPLYKVNGLASYDGVLPGITDQPNVVISFPPADSEAYTWPQKTERRVEWASFNLAAGSKVSMKLMKGGTVIDTKANLDNDMNEIYNIAESVAVGAGYWIDVCPAGERCFSSGKFSVVAARADRTPPAKAEAVFPGDISRLAPGSEAYGVFATGLKTNLAQTLGVATHRVEIEKIEGASKSRRAGGVKVSYLLHPDDTGKDQTTVEELKATAESAEVQNAVVSNLASYTAAAQTTDADVKFITESGSFSNVSEAKALREENDQLQDANTTLIIVVASLGGAVGCCCCLGGAFGLYIYMSSSKSAEAPPQPATVPASQPPMKSPIFCGKCGAQQQNPAAQFCGACGDQL